MAKVLTILLVGLIFEAIGVVLLNQGLKQIGTVERVAWPEIVRVVRDGATNPRILLGVAFEAGFFGCLLVLMARSDVRLGGMLREYIDGIPLDLASKLLPGRTWLEPGLLSHIHLHAKAQKRYADTAVAGADPGPDSGSIA